MKKEFMVVEVNKYIATLPAKTLGIEIDNIDQYLSLREAAKIIYDNLRNIRKATGLSATDAAKVVMCTKNSLLHWETKVCKFNSTAHVYIMGLFISLCKYTPNGFYRTIWELTLKILDKGFRDTEYNVNDQLSDLIKIAYIKDKELADYIIRIKFKEFFEEAI